MQSEEKRTWRDRLLEELKKLCIVVIYFWILLSVFALYRAMILTQYQISFSYTRSFGFAFINALVLGKFMLIAEALHAGERWHSKTLLYWILFKSAVFSTILLACHILEEVLVRMWHTRSMAQDFSNVNRANLNEIFSLAIIMFVVLIPFFAAREFSRVLGKGALKSLMLNRGTEIGTSSS
ncbi:MAG TPA: hypothetical protein VGH37_05560 [Candidatus Acidoferrum sp.]|jgi:hypothetical protein